MAGVYRACSRASYGLWYIGNDLPCLPQVLDGWAILGIMVYRKRSTVLAAGAGWLGYTVLAAGRPTDYGI